MFDVLLFIFYHYNGKYNSISYYWFWIHEKQWSVFGHSITKPKLIMHVFILGFGTNLHGLLRFRPTSKGIHGLTFKNHCFIFLTMSKLVFLLFTYNTWGLQAYSKLLFEIFISNILALWFSFKIIAKCFLVKYPNFQSSVHQGFHSASEPWPGIVFLGLIEGIKLVILILSIPTNGS